MAHLTCLVYAETEEERIDLRRRLEDSGHVNVVDCSENLIELESSFRESSVDLIFIGLGDDAHATLDVLERVPENHPPMVFSGPADRSELILRAMRLGAKEYLAPKPDSDELTGLFDRMMLEPVRRPKNRSLAPLIAVYGAKGGVGTTVVASQLAGALQKSGRRTALVDLNLRTGDVALHFDLDSRYTLAEAAAASGEIDAAFLRGILERHDCGLSILAAPRRSEDADVIRPAHVEQVLRLLREEFDCVVVDLPQGWDETARLVLDAASVLLLIFCFELPALAHTRKQLELFDRMGTPRDKLRLIANRYSKRNPVSDSEAERFLDRAPDARIPNDYASVMESLTSGAPLGTVAARSAVHRAFQELASDSEKWCGLEAATKPTPARSFSLLQNIMRRGQHGSH